MMFEPAPSQDPATYFAEDAQLSFVFWPDSDPNLHAAGIYEFTVDGKILSGLVKSVCFPDRSTNELEIDVTDTHLSCLSQTKDGSFAVRNRIPLSHPVNIGAQPIRFSFDQSVLKNLSRLSVGTLFFRFDREDGRLSWRYDDGCSAGYRANYLPPSRQASTGRTVGRLAPRALRAGIVYAATLTHRSLSKTERFHGVRIANQSVMSGYRGGASQFTTDELPEDLGMMLPRANVGNALFLLANQPGAVVLTEADERIYVQSNNSDLWGYWSTNGSNWPASLGAIFEPMPIASLLVSTDKFAGMANLFAAFLDDVKLTASPIVSGEGEAKEAKLEITGIFRTKPWKWPITAEILNWTPNAAEAFCELSFNMRDIYDAAMAMKSTTIEFGIFDRGLIIQSSEGNRSHKTVLWGKHT